VLIIIKQICCMLYYLLERYGWMGTNFACYVIGPYLYTYL